MNVAATTRLARLEEVIPELRALQSPCQLCPRRCGARRERGELGECGLDNRLRVAAVARHHGEEPLISGKRGTINVFFSGCHLHCVHCQNWPISQRHVGKLLTPQDLAQRILHKRRQGAHSLGFVTPTPQIVPALEAYRLCLLAGFDLPLVHNNGGYEDVRIIDLLAGIVDIWLPDAKTRNPELALVVQGAADYPQVNRAALGRMVQQVEEKRARAVVVRHLILPHLTNNSREVLEALRCEFNGRIYLSLMSQYFPTYRTIGDEALGRKITTEEYEEIANCALQLGFKRGWVQTYEVENGLPLCCLS